MIGEVYTTMAEFEIALNYQKIHLSKYLSRKNKHIYIKRYLTYCIVLIYR